MYITEERHTMFYDNPSVPSGWVEVQLSWCDGDNALIPNKPYDGEFWVEFKNSTGYLSGFTKAFYYLCAPSVRYEVERAFKDFLRYCGIRVGFVIKEAHAFYINADEAEYIVNFEGIPGQGIVQCSAWRDSGPVVNMDIMGIDIMCERELLRRVYSVLKHR